MMAAGKSPAAEIERLQNVIENARRRLYIAIRSACPGPHHPQQHRDGKPPWCRSCGRTTTGHRAAEIKSTFDQARELSEQKGDESA